MGRSHACPLTAGGEAFCWGANFSGQLGDGTYANRSAPVPVRTSMRFASLALGETHTCRRTREGEVYCWGNNTGGQVGDGSGARSWPAPVLVRW